MNFDKAMVKKDVKNQLIQIDNKLESLYLYVKDNDFREPTEGMKYLIDNIGMLVKKINRHMTVLVGRDVVISGKAKECECIAHLVTKRGTITKVDLDDTDGIFYQVEVEREKFWFKEDEIILIKED